MANATATPSYLVGKWSGPPPVHTITTVGQLFGFLGTCPHAQTMEAWSQQFKTTVWIALPCRQWGCRYCAERKIRELSVKTQRAKPNRLLTLTVDPSLFSDPRDAFDNTRRKVSECMRTLRNRFGECEYLRVTELTKNGWPHYHLMVRSPYIPHTVVRDRWNELTGARIVDIRQIKERLCAYTYLVKYLSKMHKIGWTERHVSYSKGFFREDNQPPKGDLELSDHTIIEAHPSTYLASRFRGATLTQLGINVFAFAPDAAAVDEITDAKSWAKPPDDRFPAPKREKYHHTTPPPPAGTQKPLF